jgi:CubicO group peptidase (beta-lactamase class C family)
MRRITSAFLFAVAISAAGVSARNDWKSAVDKAFADYDRPDSPGCAVGIFQGGRIAFEDGYGMADLENDVPIKPETVFYVGSVSKQFTAMAAALAIEQGKLSPDDPIRKHLPELPEYAAPITVRHLIHHTSGLRDYNTLLSIAGRRGDEAYDNPTVLRMTARQKALNFTPGDEYLYSNTGYTLLATIVERATKTPFAAYAETQIFKPLGMTVTHFHTDSGRLVKNRAYAYTRGDGGIRLDTPSNERAGAGGVYANVRDLLRWDENFYTAAVGGDAVIKKVQTPGTLNGGKPLAYAWGLQVGTYRGQPIVEHSGSLGGYRAHTLRLPSLHTSAVALCNLASATPGNRLRDALDATLRDRFTGPRASAPSLDRPARPNADRAAATPPAGAPGTYFSEEIDAVFTISSSGNGLLLKRESDAAPLPLQPTADGFRAAGMTIRFDATPDGQVRALVVDAGRVRDIRFLRR